MHLNTFMMQQSPHPLTGCGFYWVRNRYQKIIQLGTDCKGAGNIKHCRLCCCRRAVRTMMFSLLVATAVHFACLCLLHLPCRLILSCRLNLHMTHLLCVEFCLIRPLFIAEIPMALSKPDTMMPVADCWRRVPIWTILSLKIYKPSIAS